MCNLLGGDLIYINQVTRSRPGPGIETRIEGNYFPYFAGKLLIILCLFSRLAWSGGLMTSNLLYNNTNIGMSTDPWRWGWRIAQPGSHRWSPSRWFHSGRHPRRPAAGCWSSIRRGSRSRRRRNVPCRVIAIPRRRTGTARIITKQNAHRRDAKTRKQGPRWMAARRR